MEPFILQTLKQKIEIKLVNTTVYERNKLLHNRITFYTCF